MATRRCCQKKGFPISVRTADIPAQTINIDLCFVPAIHTPHQHLPAVSGSSGRLLVTRRLSSETPRAWPGQVFADLDRSYTEVMHSFATAARQRYQDGRHRLAVPPSAKQASPLRQLRSELADLQAQRRIVREARQQEDAAWQALWAERKAVLEARRREQRTPDWTTLAEDIQWREIRRQHDTCIAHRRSENAAWQARQRELRQALTDLPLPTAWRAILIVTDNCSRHCSELPLFAAGGRVTAEEVSAALQRVLPNGVQFVITDQGVHFMAKAFQHVAETEGFIHVPIARHRPESNGIAERCVRTLKEWLAPHAWASDAELISLLAQFRLEYNDRPHQGLAIAGLSPNEYARRIWLF